ncbi:hypothetical protein TNCV_2707901 [Trichonephila clavipes]|nr:hypothetical protein TNCV_2707901 [Trichonephila clavipes]
MHGKYIETQTSFHWCGWEDASSSSASVFLIKVKITRSIAKSPLTALYSAIQVTMMIFELEPPLQTTPSRKREDFVIDRFNVLQLPLHNEPLVTPGLKLTSLPRPKTPTGSGDRDR